MRTILERYIQPRLEGTLTGSPEGLTNLLGYNYSSRWYDIARYSGGSFDFSVFIPSGDFTYQLEVIGSNDIPPSENVASWAPFQVTTNLGEVILSSTSSSVGQGVLFDSSADHVPEDYFNGNLLTDAAGFTYVIANSVSSSAGTYYYIMPNQTTGVGTPVAGAYKISNNGWVPNCFTEKTLYGFVGTQATAPTEADPVQILQQPLITTVTSNGTASLVAQWPNCHFARVLLTYLGSGTSAHATVTVDNDDITTDGTGGTNSWTDTTGAMQANKSDAFTVAATDTPTTGVVTGAGPTYTWTDAASTFTSALNNDTLIDGAGLPWSITYVSAHVLTLTGNVSAATSGMGFIAQVRVGDTVTVGTTSLLATLTTQSTTAFTIGRNTTTAANIGTALAANTSIAALVTNVVTSNVIKLTAVAYGIAGNSIDIAAGVSVVGSIAPLALEGGVQGHFSATQVGWTLVDATGAGYTISSVDSSGTVLTVTGESSAGTGSGVVSAVHIGDTVSIGGVVLTATGSLSPTSAQFTVADYTATATNIGAAATANTALNAIATNHVAPPIVTFTAVVPGAPGDATPISVIAAEGGITNTAFTGGADVANGAITGCVCLQGPQ